MADLIDRTGLPANVRRWLDRSVPTETTVPDRVANSQVGEIEVRGKWMPFTATTSYDREPFALQWNAKISVLPGVIVRAEDAHNGESGWGGSKLWGLIPMGSRHGPEVFGMQFVRHLAEFPWMPQLVLGLPDLIWEDIGESTFQVSANIGGHAAVVIFTLDEKDRVIRASSNRAYDVPGGFEEAPWKCDFSDHRSFGAIEIPGRAVATYTKADGDWTYLRCQIVTST